MKLRCPRLNIIWNTIILFVVIIIASMIISLYLYNKQMIDFFIIKLIAVGCLAICAVEFIILHIYWHSMNFDESNGKLKVISRIFFFPFKNQEVSFEDIQIKLTNRYMVSTSGYGGMVWRLYLQISTEEGTREFNLANSPFKSSLHKIQKRIRAVVKR